MFGLQYLCQVGDGVKFLQRVRLDPPFLLPCRPEDLPVLLSSLGPALLDDLYPRQTVECRNVEPVSLLGLVLGLKCSIYKD